MNCLFPFSFVLTFSYSLNACFICFFKTIFDEKNFIYSLLQFTVIENLQLLWSTNMLDLSLVGEGTSSINSIPVAVLTNSSDLKNSLSIDCQASILYSKIM